MNKRRSLGQHFLISTSIAKSIVDFARLTKDDVVLEVGTGRGILTPYLCEKAKKVISVEKDSNLYLEAKEKFSKISNLVLEHGDAFKMNFDFTVFVSNLPYSESRNAIEWLVQRKFSHAIMMVQKEFAQKLLAKEGTARRAVGVLASYCMKIDKLLEVSKSNFSPSPKIDSVVIRLEQKRQVTKEMIRTINNLFSFKRKTIRHIARQFGVMMDSDKRLGDLQDGEIIEIAKKII
ncbi:MAG: 16S rRNA (adenine(1518)-N(6)/adenine(1519)-N(6))-dimethyltransferase RsmA [Nitrosotalea sp.]